MFTLILLDDEEEIRRGLKNYFPWHEVGFEVIGDFSDAETALSFLSSHPVDAVLTDIRLPNQSGLDLIRALRKSNPDLPIVILSGYRSFDYAQEAMAYGVRHYLVKPTKYQQLMDVFTGLQEELQSRRSPASSGSAEEDIADTEHILRQIKSYVHAHFQEATLENTARSVRMNPYYLSSYFHQKTGEKFSDYLLRIRMKEAAKLLTGSSLSVNDISFQVGYTAPNSFSRSFRQYYDMTPSDYRRVHQKEALQ